MYDQPVEAPSFGTRISTSMSPGAERRLEDAGEEVRRRDDPLAVRAPHDQLGIEREHHGRQVGGRIAVRERTADRAAVPHLRIADHARPSCETIGQCSCRSGASATSLCRVSAPIASCVAGVAHIASSASRPMSTSFDGRAMRSFSAGTSEWPPAISLASSSAAEQLERVVDALGDLVVEPCRDHCFASSIARQTRSGVAGIWISVTPRCESASTTALITAGAAAIVPVSPTPFAPNGFVGLVLSVRSSSNDGQLGRRRHEVRRHASPFCRLPSSS